MAAQREDEMDTNLIFNIDIEPAVHEVLVTMFDRYIEVARSTSTKFFPPPMMSYKNFVNMIMLKGFIEYNKELIKLEQK